VKPIAPLADRVDHEASHGKAVRDMFDRIAPTYDMLNRTLSVGQDVAWRRRAVRELETAPAGPLLDLCAGTMDLTALLVRRFPGARVVALDLSPEMLRHGRSKAPGAETVVGDALDLPFGDGEFAAVVCGFGMRNVADVPRAVREVRRALGPRGVFVTLDAFRPAHRAARWIHEVYTRVLFPALGGVVSGDRAAYAYFVESVAGFVTRADYERILRDAGFARVRGRDLMLGAASMTVAEVSA
jgi:ubiquinone/menaquinone biosynthesis methyltransferase